MKRFWKKSISVLMTIVMFVGLAVDLRFGAVEVLAATYNAVINNSLSYLMINGQVIDSNNNKVDFSNGSMPFDIHLVWNLDNSQKYVKGDKIVVQLPEQLSFANITNGIQTVGVIEAGTYTVQDGCLTITLTKDIDSNAQGINDLDGTLNNDKLGDINNGEYNFSIFDKSYTIDVQNSTKASSLSVSKWTNGDTYDSEKGYNYVVQITSGGTNSGISLNDYFGTDMELTSDVTVSSSISGKNVTGTLSNSTKGGFTYTIDPNYTMEDRETLTISYSAKVADSIFNSFNGNLNVNNTATVKSTESGEKSGSTTKYLSRSLISKSASLSADKQSVNWTITVNGTNPVDISGAKISDVLPGDYDITSDIVMTSSKNETVIIPNNGKKFEYTFPDGSDTTYTIHFTTSVDTSGIPVATGGNTTPNTAKLTINGTDYESNPASVYVPGIGNFHTKQAVSYEVKTIDGKEVGVIHWVNTITVPDPEICPLNDFVFFDNGASWQQVNQTVRDGSLTVLHNGRTVNPSNYTFGMLNNANTFQINFGDYFADARKDDTILISYDTYFDPVSFETSIYNYSQIKLDNRNVSEASGYYRFVPLVNKSIIENKADTDGVNRIFRWCVKIDLADYDHLPDTLTFKDILPENQTLVSGTVELWNSMWWDGAPARLPVTESDGVMTMDIDKNTLHGKMDSENFVYLHYNTTFADVSEFLMSGTKSYTNTVEVYDKTSGAFIDRSKASTGNITPPENKAVDKRLVLYNDYTAGFVYYAIDVNTAGIKYLKEDGGQLKLTDTLGNALNYVVGSLKVYTDPEHHNIMDTGRYTMSYDRNKNEIVLNLPDETPCYITYTAKVNITKDQYPQFSNNPSDPNYAGNDVKLEGQGNHSVSDSAPLMGNVANTSGTINYNLASVSLYKSDIANFASGLPGAEYTARVVAIWEDGTWEAATDEVLAEKNISNSVIIKKTDSDGQILFSQLSYDYLYEITETKAPGGYQLNDDIVYVYFVGLNNSAFKTALKDVAPYAGHEIIEIKREAGDISDDDLYYELLAQDKKLPKELKFMYISKQAAFGSTGELGGATLRLKDTAGNVLTEWTTGSDSRKFYIYEAGIDESEYDGLLLKPDTNYILEEVSAPTGYAVAAPITFSVDSNGKVNLTNTNTLIMKDNRAIYINKVDSNQNNLSGATLGVFHNGSEVMRFNTGSAYKIEVTDMVSAGGNPKLIYGVEYTLRELTTPTGYKKFNDITFTVSQKGEITVNSGLSDEYAVSANKLTLNVTDKNYVTLKIVKQDTNGNPLSGAEFEIKAADGTTSVSGVSYEPVSGTGSDGVLTIRNLTYGDYVIVEKNAPTGYEIISEKTPITLGGTGGNTVPIVNGVASKVITNSKLLNEKGHIRITKKDGSGNLLSGAVFKLTNTAGTAKYTATATTNDNGIAEFLNVPYGTYTLTEETAPYGYAFKASDTYTNTNSHGTLSAAAGNKSCTITLDETHTGSTYDDTKTFEISATNTLLKGSLSFKKTDQNDNPVSGAEFTLTDNKNTAKKYQAVSDAAGKVSFTGLPYGTYTLTETSVPAYYTGWIKGSLQVTIDSEEEVTLSDIANTRLSVFIDKRSLNKASTLTGAELGIYAASDTGCSTPLLQWNTETSAQQFYLGAVTEKKDGVMYIAQGNYILHEINVPSGYRKASDITFEVSYNGTDRTASIVSTGNVQDGILVMYDEPVGTLKLTKKDANLDNGSGGNVDSDGHALLPGAAFELYRLDAAGSRTRITEGSTTHTGTVDGSTETFTDVYVTDSNGVITVPNLSYGTYVFKEVCPPDDYIITNQETTFVLSSDMTAHTVYNTKKVDQFGEIRITKKDNSSSPKLLENARFELYHLNGEDKYEFIAGSTTDQNGAITFQNIPYGTYTIVERSTPKDYKIVDSDSDKGVTITYKNGNGSVAAEIKNGQLLFEVTIDATTAKDSITDASGQTTDGYIEISVVNEKKKRSFSVKKTGNDTSGNGLAGAEFALYSDEGCAEADKKYSATTDLNGIAEFTDVLYGTYYLKEIKAPEGYEITQTAPIQVVLDDTTEGLYTGSSPLTVEDDRIILHINKFVTGTEKTVDGANLTISNADGTYQRVWNTSSIADLKLYLADSKERAIELNNKGTGNYIYEGVFTLKETNPPAGYFTAPEITFEVENGRILAPDASDARITDNNTNLILYDKPYGSISITKVDAENKTLLLDGVEFKLYHAADVSSIDSVDGLAGITPFRDGKTGKNGNPKGTLVFDELPLGEYALFETSVPDGYLRVSKKYNVNVTTAGIKVELEISNIHESSAGNIELKKTDEGGTPLSDAVFKLVNANNETIEVATGQTGADGIVRFENVPFGTYKLIEITPPSGYSISLKDTAGHTEDDYVVNDDKKSVTVYLTKANCVGADEAAGVLGTLSVNVTDDILRGNLQVSKVDSKSGEGLSGVEFVLKDAAGNYFNQTDRKFDGTEHKYTTDSDGKLTITDIPFTPDPKKPYVLEEVNTPTGYVNVTGTDAAKHEVIIDKDNRLEEPEATAITVKNDVLTADFTIRKIENGSTLTDGDDGLEGAVYNLYSDSDCKNLVATGITGEDGRYTFEKLAYGTYYLKEISAPANYMVDKNKISVKIPDNISTVVPAALQDRDVADDIGKGSLVIEKKEEHTGNSLSGATFELYGLKPDNTLGNLIDTKTTGADGKVTFTDLNYGYYMVKETGVPPYYMALTETVESIPVTEDHVDENGIATQVINNRNISIQISKRAANTIIDLEGARLGIFADGTTGFDETNAIMSWTSSSEDPKVIYLGNESGKLKPDETYILAELKAPTGYLKANPMKFSVDSSGKVTLIDRGTGSHADGSDARTPGTLLNTEDCALIVMYDDEEAPKDIQISKKAVDENDELPDAKLKIVKADNPDKTLLSWTTGTTPRIISVGIGKILQYDTDYYLVEEQAPQGYALAQPIPFYVSRDGSIVLGSVEQAEAGASGEVSITAEGISQLTMRDRIADGSIFISKKDILGITELPGAHLTVTDKITGDIIDEWDSGDDYHEIKIGITPKTLVTGKTYILKEIKAPEGYDTADDIEFTIHSDETIRSDVAAQTGNVSLDGKILTMLDKRTCEITISKKAVGKTNELEGARLTILTDNAERKVVDEWTSEKDGHKITVGANGKLSFSTSYILHETAAPDGYMVAEDIRFSVGADGKIITLAEVSDDGTTLTMRDSVWDNAVFLSKKEEGGTKELQGSKLVVYDESGNIVEQWTSEKEAHRFTIGPGGILKYGEIYTMHEEAAPDGYLLTDDILFTVNTDGTIMVINKNRETAASDNHVSADGKMLTMYDPAEPTADAFTSEDGPPKTGDKTPVALLVVLLLIALGVIVGLAVTGKKNLAIEALDEQTDEENKESNN